MNGTEHEPGDTEDAIEEPPAPEDNIPDADGLPAYSRIRSVHRALQYIHALRNSRLEDSAMAEDDIERLRNPLEEEITLDDPDERYAVDLYVSLTDGDTSDQSYTKARDAYHRHPNHSEILSLHSVKRKISDITGITSIVHDMCPNVCHAYTGPLADFDSCQICKEPRRDDAGRPRLQFHTYPFGPQVQARYRSPKAAEEMHYLEREMELVAESIRASGKLGHFDDICYGADVWEAYESGAIGKNDTLAILSMDGAQLYKNKESNCWIYIWILVNVSPLKRYKKAYILPGAIIPGPGKPKLADSYIFPGLHHFIALQKEGLTIWDASSGFTFISRPYLLLATADAVGAPAFHAGVGHHGRLGCREGCIRIGRRKPDGSHYYAACLKLQGYAVEGCSHEDDDPANINYRTEEQLLETMKYLIASPNVTEYERRRLETGYTRPSIFWGMIRRSSLLRLFPGDIMHLLGLNIPDLFIRLWRGLFHCDTELGDNKSTWDWVVLVGDVWKRLGKEVGEARRFFPGSFDRPPRNPAEKINSGYKCLEFIHLFYGILPGFLHGILPDLYWRHFCKLVTAARIIFQPKVHRTQVEFACHLLRQFSYEYEIIYVRRKVSRLHFVPQCMHGLSHLSPSTIRIGPLPLSCQFPIERTIGDLGAELRQPSNPFANLAQRALRRAQVNGLKAMVPDLAPEKPIVSATMPSQDLGNGYYLLHPRDTRVHAVTGAEADAIRTFFARVGVPEVENGWIDPTNITRWARLRLPNGHVARTAWREKANATTREARNIKVTSMPPNIYYYVLISI